MFNIELNNLVYVQNFSSRHTFCFLKTDVITDKNLHASSMFYSFSSNHPEFRGHIDHHLFPKIPKGVKRNKYRRKQFDMCAAVPRKEDYFTR